MSATWSLPETDSRLIESILEELLGRTQALAAHLVDRSGRPVATVGDARGYDLTTFASLASADLAANDELARLLGEPHVDGVACLGSYRSMASSRIGDQLVLCVVFDGHSSLGLVRHRMKRATERLWALFQSLADRTEPSVRPPGREHYEEHAAAAVDDLLGGDESERSRAALAFVHEAARQVHFKIVYAGPARGGKTTNLLTLYSRLPAERRGRLLSLAGAEERTLFFDFMALNLGEVGGLDTRFHLYTVPGQPEHKRSRRAVLRGADVVVFVADSAPERRYENAAAWRELDEPGFLEGGERIVQYNKRDLADALPVSELRDLLGTPAGPEVEAAALEGRGVYESLRLACRAALGRFSPVA